MKWRTKKLNGSVEEFAKAASAYCALIESYRHVTRQALLERANHAISSLYVFALELPVVHTDCEVEDRFGVPEWKKLVSGLARKLGRTVVYWLVFNPDTKEEPVAGNLADDFADIYGDLKPALTLYSGGSTEQKKAAVWQWRFGFYSHWGDHATGALRALHRLTKQ